VRDGPGERRSGDQEADREEVVAREGREVVEDSGLVGEGAVCSRLLEGEVGTGLGLRGRAEEDRRAEEGEDSMPCLVEEADNWRMPDKLLVAVAAQGSAEDSLVLLEGIETVAERPVWELFYRVAGCLSLRH